jgi:hypothetical protein
MNVSPLMCVIQMLGLTLMRSNVLHWYGVLAKYVLICCVAAIQNSMEQSHSSNIHYLFCWTLFIFVVFFIKKIKTFRKFLILCLQLTGGRTKPYFVGPPGEVNSAIIRNV